MPNLELNFNPNHYQLIGETVAGYLGEFEKTYIRVIVLSQDGSIINLSGGNSAIFYSTLYSGDEGINIQLPGIISQTDFVNISDTLDDNGDSRTEL